MNASISRLPITIILCAIPNLGSFVGQRTEPGAPGDKPVSD
ncbi:hypothetical protein ABZ897_23175 [Nonomuraea sp. NPDC046802]